METPEPIYDPALSDGRFQLEILGLRWALIALYAVFAFTGVVDVSPGWFAGSECFLIAYHIYYTWYTWHEMTREPLPAYMAYATPFCDAAAVSVALIAVGDPLHPIWGVYFSIIVGVAFFYYGIARQFTAWLLLNYLFVGIGLQLRGLYVAAPAMGVGAVVLLAGMANVIAYTNGERRLRGRIAVAARTDPLTGLLNRRGLEEQLSRRLASERADDRPLSVLMLDIDRFKRTNDQFGHLAADGILEHLAEVLSTGVRDPDLIARYGGDEFVVLAPGVSGDDALLLAERLRLQVTRFGLCTVSIGVATTQGEVSSTRLLDLADLALLEAKQAGRNRVRASLPPVSQAA